MSRLLIITGSDGLLGRALVETASTRNISYIPITRRSSSNDTAQYIEDSIHTDKLSRDQILKLEDPNVFKTIINCAWSGEKNLTDGGMSAQLSNLKFVETLIKFAEEYCIHSIYNIGTMDEIIVERLILSENARPFEFSHLNYALAKSATRDIFKFLCYVKKIDFVHARISIIIDKKLRGSNFVERNLRSILNNKSYEQPSSSELYNICTSDYVANQIIDYIEQNNTEDLILGNSLVMTLSSFFQSISMCITSENLSMGNSTGSVLVWKDFHLNEPVCQPSPTLVNELLNELSNE